VDHPAAAAPYSPVIGTLFGPDGPSYLDVEQGQEGDCWLMSSLAETAVRAPADIINMFTYDGTAVENGAQVTVYTVRLYDNSGTARYVTVDTELPAGGTLYDQVNNVLWVALAEKAYAQANGAGMVTTAHIGIDSYDALGNLNNTGGSPLWALQAITGRPANGYSLNPGDIANAWNAGQLIVLGTPPLGANAAVAPSIDGVNIVSDHAYAVVGYNAATQMFTLFNPWGANGGYESLGNGNLVFCGGTVTATAQQIASVFSNESFGIGTAVSYQNSGSAQDVADLIRDDKKRCV
jgi:hypothetical protein